MLSWGQRVTIINKATELFERMDGAPYQFITQHTDSDLERFLDFKHRTFQPDDTLYFIDFFRRMYSEYDTMQDAFVGEGMIDVKSALQRFHHYFFDSPNALQRTRKHVSTPARKSSCKRLNMFLRWMVRRDDRGVDFGLWDRIDPAMLMIPLDVHVFNVSRQVGLLTRDKTDWMAVEELTEQLRSFDPSDPVKYDYALFTMGLEKRQAIF